MKKTGMTNANDYRASLQSNAESIMKNTVNDFDTNFKCKNSGSNLFYLDSSSYNGYYDKINAEGAKPEVQNYQKILAKGTGLDAMGSNMSLNALSFSSVVPKNNTWA
jgi:methionine salvage enolase-phosphatase E1